MTARKDVQKILNRRFDDLTLIDEALVADGAHEKARDNAREHGNKGLALIGDALLRLVIVDDCMTAGYSTGRCDHICSKEVCNDALKKLEESLDVGKHIELDDAQQGQVSRTTGASTMEALVGAAWLDCHRDYQTLHRTVHELGIADKLARTKTHKYE